MFLKARTPTARAARQGLDLDGHFPATSDISPIIFALPVQEDLAVRHLVARFGLSAATASAVASANAWGRQ